MTDPVHDPVHRARHAFEPDGENMVVETWIEPGGGLPPHYHPAQEERWSVLEGRIRIQLGDSKRVIGPEDGELVVTPGTKHGFASVEDADAHLRCYVTPGARPRGFPHGERRRRPRGPLPARRRSPAAGAARAGRRTS